MKQIVSAFVAFVIVIGIIYSLHPLVHLDDMKSDKELIVALEKAAVVILFASVIAREALHFFVYIFKLLTSQVATNPHGEWRSLMTLFATVFVSLAIYFGFSKYVLPL